MQFNSLVFLVFFVCVLLVRQLPVLSWKGKKVFLLLASWFFYGFWVPSYLLLLWISTVVDWIAGSRIHRSSDPVIRKRWLIVSLVVNLGLLGFFKYWDFFIGTTVAVMGALGVPWSPEPLGLILPIGISFYTFQTLSYTLDIYRGDFKPSRSFLDYSFYVAFFPQLVAGPIVRARQFLPQCDEDRRVTTGELGWGLGLVILGLFEKVVVSDALIAPVSKPVFHALADLTFWDAWIGIIAGGSRFFFDFAGYSTCAIGAGLCLGFRLPINFRFPLMAVGFTDFWRRWHISLISWVIDYVYRPMGGGRGRPVTVAARAIFIFCLIGLWHGAAWRFFLWGVISGAFLVFERVLRQTVPDRPLWSSAPFQWAMGLLTYLVVCFLGPLFGAHDLARAGELYRALVGLGNVGPMELPPLTAAIAMTTVGVTLWTHRVMRDRSLEEMVERCPAPLVAAAIAIMVVAIATVGESGIAYVYFAF